jgi:hypothetical protein
MVNTDDPDLNISQHLPSSPTLEETLEKAKSAFVAEDYKSAFEIWKPLAEKWVIKGTFPDILSAETEVFN